MATRLYVTSRVPGTKLLGPPLGNWSGGDSGRDNRGQNGFIFRLAQTKDSGGVAIATPINVFANVATAATGQKMITSRWVTDRLGADVTITGTLTFTVRVSLPDTSLGQSCFGQMYAYVSVGDTLTKRAVLVNNVTDSTAWSNSTIFRSMVFACTSANALTGDRIVVEFGASATPGTGGGNTFAVEYGTTNTSNVNLADAVDTSGAAGAAWAEFSTTLSWQADPAPPANDACADAVVIAAVPYVSPAIDTTTSTDTGRRVWYTWTADRTGRMFVTTWGGNYSTLIRVYTGGCSGLVFVIGSLSAYIAWVGTSQAVSTFDATQGVQYWFQVESYYVTAGSDALYSAIDSGGSLVLQLFPQLAPAYGDVFVDCQHIVCFREGVPINVTPNFYNLTPTGCAIDYTLRTLDDLNGGTNSNYRLYTVLFGAGPLAEILDLTTLDVTGSEIDYILDPIDTVPHSQNASSASIDVNGNLVMGYFGDAYSVQGGLSSPTACAITRLNATHADNQAGAPWAVADRFTITQENSGSDYIDVSLDGSTAFYTSAGVKILRYNMDTTTQLADFGTIPAQTNVRPGARGLKLFPPQDGTTGLVVPAGDIIYRLNGSGAVVQTYAPSNSTVAQDLDKCDFSPDSTSIWVSDQYSTHLFKFNVATGTQLLDIDTGLPPGQLSGFAVFGSRKLSTAPLVNLPFVGETVPIRRQRTGPVISAEEKRIIISRLQFVMQPGIGATNGQGSDPEVMLEISRDNGHTFGTIKRGSAGAIGNFIKQTQFFKNGQARNWVLRLTVSDPVVPWVLIDALGELEPGPD